ncbi:MAG: hypothetical protein COA63_013940 [Methylophaga sp.]|nr:hypothetical protein [Methylophaga sp.]
MDDMNHLDPFSNYDFFVIKRQYAGMKYSWQIEYGTVHQVLRLLNNPNIYVFTEEQETKEQTKILNFLEDK